MCPSLLFDLRPLLLLSFYRRPFRFVRRITPVPFNTCYSQAEAIVVVVLYASQSLTFLKIAHETVREIFFSLRKQWNKGSIYIFTIFHVLVLTKYLKIILLLEIRMSLEEIYDFISDIFYIIFSWRYFEVNVMHNVSRIVSDLAFSYFIVHLSSMKG